MKIRREISRVRSCNLRSDDSTVLYLQPERRSAIKIVFVNICLSVVSDPHGHHLQCCFFLLDVSTLKQDRQIRHWMPNIKYIRLRSDIHCEMGAAPSERVIKAQNAQ